MKKFVILFLSISIISYLLSCAHPDPSINQPVEINNINTDTNIISNDSQNKSGTLKTSLVIDIYEETKKVLNKSTLEGFRFDVISEQNSLFIPTNHGVMIKYNVETKQKEIIQNLKNDDLLHLGYQSFIFNHCLAIISRSERYSLGITIHDLKTLEKLGEKGLLRINQILFTNKDRIYARGFGNNIGQYFLAAYDKELNFLWSFPDLHKVENELFPLLDSFEINNNFHLIYNLYNDPYLRHVVIKSNTGKILLDEKIIQDLDEIWNEAQNNPEEVGNRIMVDGTDVFIEGQDKQGLYLAKFTINNNFTLTLQWKHPLTNYMYSDNMVRGGTGITNVTNNKGSFLLIPLWKKSENSEKKFDLCCVNKMDGKIKWINQSLIGYDLNISTSDSSILLDTGYLSNNTHSLYSLDVETGKTLWNRTLQDKFISGQQIHNLQVTCNSPFFFVFDYEKQALSGFDYISGKESIHMFESEYTNSGKFIKNNNHVFFLSKTSNMNTNQETPTALLYVIGE